ncbi:uncharacterized protein LOC132756342 [Ruditapes philippinarum]|uniref:uncharacterized protein LOC132756342 n=1 Tax=Ruditapes philippinarum TaxID=129788 RepID=UPI00295AB459|nr:uncharacterized protein LOC132756342 [Ruditapes philippinarum]XP_060603387.1 uncharacterized protein LOC132756342 [Ruditapes philippinarum]XP_060603394.1 uncharacterized protein LOC132756342 [Ruditapes philippinarum]XP_060603401.1 uncharacterized protein LOC132756342 [Ruditapes philippinarum]
MESEGNINIVDDTVGGVETTEPKDEKYGCKWKGNVKIFDDTKSDSEAEENSAKDYQSNSDDPTESSEDENKPEFKETVQKCKKQITKISVKTEPDDLNSKDCVSDTNNNLSEMVCVGENSNSDMLKSKTIIVKTKQSLCNEIDNEQNESGADGKSGDDLHLPFKENKNCSNDFADNIEDFSPKDHVPEEPLEDCVGTSNKGISQKAEIAEFNPFFIKLEEVPIEPENTSISSVEKASDNFSGLCDFCNPCKSAMFTCNNCKFFYCIECRTNLHPNRGPFKSHKVILLDGRVVVEHHEKCEEHGLVAQLFCSYCEQKRCAECANTKCFLHFKGKVSGADIEREKTLLVEELERATTKLAFLGRYKEMVEKEYDQVELTGLLRKEQIRQEFVSFHDLLITKEAEMLEVLDQDVQERLNHIRDTLQASVVALEREDALLTTTVTELVQSENDAKFIEECVNAKELCSQAYDKIRKFNRDWAKNSEYKKSQVLDNPFSMFLEKRQLHESLDAAVSTIPEVKFNEMMLYLDTDSVPLQISDYLQIPVVPPSTQVQYVLQLSFCGKVVYEKEMMEVKEMILNTEETVKLERGCRYLVKVQPTYKYFVNSTDKLLERGNSAHMLIVVEYNFKGKAEKVVADIRSRSPLVAGSPKHYSWQDSRCNTTFKLPQQHSLGYLTNREDIKHKGKQMHLEYISPFQGEFLERKNKDPTGEDGEDTDEDTYDDEDIEDSLEKRIKGLSNKVSEPHTIKML